MNQDRGWYVSIYIFIGTWKMCIVVFYRQKASIHRKNVYSAIVGWSVLKCSFLWANGFDEFLYTLFILCIVVLAIADRWVLKSTHMIVNFSCKTNQFCFRNSHLMHIILSLLCLLGDWPVYSDSCFSLSLEISFVLELTLYNINISTPFFLMMIFYIVYFFIIFHYFCLYY